MIRFYAPDIVDDTVLPESESVHAVRVLRHREGDRIEVVDGKGWIYGCTITEAHSKHARFRIDSCTAQSKSWRP